MNASLVNDIVNAVLYEGYILYPYRASSKKNQRERFTFGRVYPEAYSAAQNGREPFAMQAECLVHTISDSATLSVSVGFLHLLARNAGESPFIWHEAVERKVVAPVVNFKTATTPILATFDFPARKMNGETVPSQEAVKVAVEIAITSTNTNLFKLTVRVSNHTPVSNEQLNDPNAVLMRTLASTHIIFNATGAEFISLMDAPAEFREAASECKNFSCWPVLVGDESCRERDTMLASPIILYDYPKIAPESAGPMFDGTEIDEILTLRIQTLTDEEKREMRHDEFARRLLERTETLPRDALLKMHAALRKPSSETVTKAFSPRESNKQDACSTIEFDDFFGANTSLEGVCVGGTFLKAGDRVRIRPKARADVFDLALSGKTAVIEAVEQDMEKRVHLAVVLESDPGKDLGFLRQPGHRFFYGVDEVEPLKEELR